MDSSSSYVKVYRLLLNTPEGQALETELVKAIDTVKVNEVIFNLQRGEKHPEAVPRFKIEFGDTVYNSDVSGNVSINVRNVVTSKKCQAIIRDRFGKDKIGSVSTFNCKKDSVESGSWKGRTRIDSFHDWVTEELQKKYQGKMCDAQDRLRAEVRTMSQSETFEARKHEALKDYAITAIIAVMADYAWLGKEVLKEALDQYICHSVIEC